MLEVLKSESLFATPLKRFRVLDHETLDTQLLAEAARLRAGDDGVNKSNRAGWHSSGNLFDDDAPALVRVREAATQAVYAATDAITRSVDPRALRMKMFAWMNANPPGGFNAPHTHPGAHWSGVYYVSQPEVETGSSGMIEFLDPRSDLPNWRILDAKPFRPKRRIRPAAGEIVIFPSYLVHWVYPNESSHERVTIAFNATFRKPRTAR